MIVKILHPSLPLSRLALSSSIPLQVFFRPVSSSVHRPLEEQTGSKTGTHAVLE